MCSKANRAACCYTWFLLSPMPEQAVRFFTSQDVITTALEKTRPPISRRVQRHDRANEVLLKLLWQAAYSNSP